MPVALTTSVFKGPGLLSELPGSETISLRINVGMVGSMTRRSCVLKSVKTIIGNIVLYDPS